MKKINKENIISCLIYVIIYNAVLAFIVCSVAFFAIKAINLKLFWYDRTDCYINNTQIVAQKITKDDLFRLEVVYQHNDIHCTDYKTGNSYHDLELYAEMKYPINSKVDGCYKNYKDLICNPKKIKNPWYLTGFIILLCFYIASIPYLLKLVKFRKQPEYDAI